MALATITETLELPGGVLAATVRKITVRLRLVVDADTEGIGRAEATPASVGGARFATVDSTGTYTFTSVRPNSGSSDDVITSPAGTVYELVVRFPDRGAVTRYVSVPDTAGPHQVGDIITVAPDPLPTGQDLLDLIDAAGLDLTDLPAGVTADGVVGLDGGALVELTPAQVMASHTGDTSDAHDASAISYAGGTGMSATDVEAAIDELATEKADVSGETFSGDVIVQVTGATGKVQVGNVGGNNVNSLAVYGDSAHTQPISAVGSLLGAGGVLAGPGGATTVDTYLIRSAAGVWTAGGGGVTGLGKGLTLTEQSAPSSPAANDITLYAADDGGGTTVLRTKDSAGTVTTLGSGGGGLTAEDVRDTIGTALVAGEGIDITVNDGADTISIAAEDATDANKGVVELATTAEARTGSSTSVVLTAEGGAAAAIDLSTPMAVGRYYPTGVNAGANPLTLDRLHYVPISFRRACTLDRIGLAGVTATVASSVARLGIYTDADGLPAALVLDAGTVATSSGTGVKEITVSQAVDRGRYWLAYVSQAGASGATVRTISGYDTARICGPSTLSDFNTSNLLSGYYEASVSGSLPSTATPLALFGPVPVMIVRASA